MQKLRKVFCAATLGRACYLLTMDVLFSDLSNAQLTLALCIGLLAGAVKGMVGFALPMILISGLGTFLAPELALAGLILPTVVTNTWQALRQGLRVAWDAVVRFRVFLLVGLCALLVSAQFVRALPGDLLLLLIGIPVGAFAVMQLLGLRFHLDAPSTKVEAGVGVFAGLIGGISGVWGPPTVAYLTALDTPKAEQMRIQGVIYGLGAVALVAAHLKSGVLRADTIPFSVLLLAPTLLGMWIGSHIQDRIDQDTFRKATLAVLLVASLNLIRRAAFG